MLDEPTYGSWSSEAGEGCRVLYHWETTHELLPQAKSLNNRRHITLSVPFNALSTKYAYKWSFPLRHMSPIVEPVQETDIDCPKGSGFWFGLPHSSQGMCCVWSVVGPIYLRDTDTSFWLWVTARIDGSASFKGGFDEPCFRRRKLRHAWMSFTRRTKVYLLLGTLARGEESDGGGLITVVSGADQGCIRRHHEVNPMLQAPSNTRQNMKSAGSDLRRAGLAVFLDGDLARDRFVLGL